MYNPLEPRLSSYSIHLPPLIVGIVISFVIVIAVQACDLKKCQPQLVMKDALN